MQLSGRGWNEDWPYRPRRRELARKGVQGPKRGRRGARHLLTSHESDAVPRRGSRAASERIVMQRAAPRPHKFAAMSDVIYHLRYCELLEAAKARRLLNAPATDRRRWQKWYCEL